MRMEKGSHAGGSHRRESGSDAKYDALEVLKTQHREVEDLFSRFEKSKNDKERFSVVQAICQKLEVHSTIEEELLYPIARNAGEDGELKEIVLQSLEEHLSVERIIDDLRETTPGDESLRARVNVLKEQILHHVQEEERELFPRLKRELPGDERRSIGEQLLARAKELDKARH